MPPDPPYDVVLSRDAAKTLRRMPANKAALVLTKITELARDPLRPNRNVRRLVHSARWRLRIGDWRVIYEIEATRLLIFVIRIGPRGSVYDD